MSIVKNSHSLMIYGVEIIACNLVIANCHLLIVRDIQTHRCRESSYSSPSCIAVYQRRYYSLQKPDDRAKNLSAKNVETNMAFMSTYYFFCSILELRFVHWLTRRCTTVNDVHSCPCKFYVKKLLWLQYIFVTVKHACCRQRGSVPVSFTQGSSLCTAVCF